MGASHVLAHLHAYTQLPFLDSPNHLPRDGTAHSGLGRSTLIIGQENATQTDARTPIS